MAGLVVAGDGMRPTCEIRAVVTDICGRFLGLQQKWISGDATHEEWRWVQEITQRVWEKEQSPGASSN